MEDYTPTKICRKCNQEFPATTEYFHADKGGKYGLKSTCKKCFQVYYQANRDEKLEQSREYYQANRDKKREYQQANRDKIRARKQKHRQANLAKLREKDREYRQVNQGKISEYKRQYRLENLDAITEYMREYRQANQDKLIEYRREYYQANRDEILEQRRQYGQANRDKIRKYRRVNRARIREKQRQYYLVHPDKVRLYASNRRARKRQLPNTFTPAQWSQCLEYFNYCCAVCGVQLRDLFGDVEPHADHWLPLSSPECLGTTVDNMLCLCSSCNLSKNAKPPEQWLTEKFGKRKAAQILERIQTYFEWTQLPK